MAQIVFNIDNSKIERVKAAMVGLYPIPSVKNPAYDPKDPNSKQEIPKFTPAEWVKECGRLWIIKQVARYETKVRIEKDAVLNNPEDTLVS